MFNDSRNDERAMSEPETHETCTFRCQGCGKTAPGVWRDPGWGWCKPAVWFQRSDDDGPQVVCSRACIERVSEKSGKAGLVLPI